MHQAPMHILTRVLAMSLPGASGSHWADLEEHLITKRKENVEEKKRKKRHKKIQSKGDAKKLNEWNCYEVKP
jgi:serine protease inhibitor